MSCSLLTNRFSQSSPVNVWPEHLARHQAVGSAFDAHALPQRDGSTTCDPLPHHSLGDSQTPSERGLRLTLTCEVFLQCHA